MKESENNIELDARVNNVELYSSDKRQPKCNDTAAIVEGRVQKDAIGHKELLLHMCCGPCSCYPVKKLRQDGIEPVGYFFNPNIHPYKEWDMRLKAAKEFAKKVNMEIITDENYMLRDFLRKALSAEAVENGRCRMCYTWRLEQTAKYAAENGYQVFSSTLFYSIYQQHELMKETAEFFAKKYGVEFYYEDFRPGWQEGIDISLELELYRQPYCGCIFSEEERYSRAIRKARKKANKAKKRARLAAEAKAAEEA